MESGGVKNKVKLGTGRENSRAGVQKEPKA